MRTNQLASILLAALAPAAVACGRPAADEAEEYGAILHFDTARVALATPRGSVPLVVEVAATEEQRRLGLMERRALPDSAGMLFVYPGDQPATEGFWMFRTRIPLDIAFLDSAGTVRAVRTMPPCTAEIAQGCPTYTPDVPYRHALEVNAGLLARLGVAVGTKVALPPLAAAPRTSAP